MENTGRHDTCDTDLHLTVPPVRANNRHFTGFTIFTIYTITTILGNLFLAQKLGCNLFLAEKLGY